MRRPLASTLMLALALNLVTALGCDQKVNAAECDALMNRLVDITLDEDPRVKGLSADAGDAIRATSKKALFADPEVKRIEAECRSEVTKAELACAMKATTSQAWNACLE